MIHTKHTKFPHRILFIVFASIVCVTHVCAEPQAQSLAAPVGVVSRDAPNPAVSVRNWALTVTIKDAHRKTTRDYFGYVLGFDGSVYAKRKLQVANGIGKMVVRKMPSGLYKVVIQMKRGLRPSSILSEPVSTSISCSPYGLSTGFFERAC